MSADTDQGVFSDNVMDAREEAKGKGLILICKIRGLSEQQKWPIRRQTFRVLEQPVVLPRRLKAESAQVYGETSTLLHSAHLELVQRSDSSAAVGANWTQGKQLTWL
jgi:hypothetical protein